MSYKLFHYAFCSLKLQSFRLRDNCNIIVPTDIWKILIFGRGGEMHAQGVITKHENKRNVS